MTEKKLNKELTKIAKEHIVSFETFEKRWSDSLDFLETSVWSLESALKAAYELGLEQGKKESKE